MKSNKLIDAKLKNMVSTDPKPVTVALTKPSSLKKNTKPNTFYQAADQLV